MEMNRLNATEYPEKAMDMQMAISDNWKTYRCRSIVGGQLPSYDSDNVSTDTKIIARAFKLRNHNLERNEVGTKTIKGFYGGLTKYKVKAGDIWFDDDLKLMFRVTTIEGRIGDLTRLTLEVSYG